MLKEKELTKQNNKVGRNIYIYIQILYSSKHFRVYDETVGSKEASDSNTQKRHNKSKLLKQAKLGRLLNMKEMLAPRNVVFARDW